MTRQQRRFAERQAAKLANKKTPDIIANPPSVQPSGSLHVYSAHCAWHGPIANVGTLVAGEFEIKGQKIKSHGLPCCPHCKSVLYQIEEDRWWSEAINHEKRGATNYVEFLRWTEAQPRCWPKMEVAAMAFVEATGKLVRLRP